ncbi:MAG TPA: hypothetical protein GXX35_03720 [Thermoanaerobacterales bacterium]|nr:hypothetical protein [Thermoanaerobacterales bacterium]
MYGTRKIALGGILSALVVILLYLAAVLHTSRLFLLSLCSFAVSVVIIEGGLATGLMFYGATSILAFLLVPDKTMPILYISFFGIYGFAKALIEKHITGIFQYILKFIFFNICFFVIYLSAGLIISISMSEIKLPLPLWIIITALQTAFLFYDRVFTIVISYYCNRFRKIIIS